MTIKNFLAYFFLVFSLACGDKSEGFTEITKWQDGKRAAVSLTFDDGTRNQFLVAMPMLDSLKMPATFYVITGEIEGSDYQGKYIGRPIEDIIKGTADTATNKDNFFERASAIGFSGYKGALAFHSDAGSLYEQGETERAYRLIDSGYQLIRTNKIQKVSGAKVQRHLSWDSIKVYAARGHEFASHTVTHPRLAVLTEPNLLYELEKSKEDIAKHLGVAYTFSAECPYGTEDERVMSYAYKVYPALRNRMPQNWLAELNRSSKVQPGSRSEEYVQWQRGAVTKTSLPLIKSWVDTVVAHDKDWLVLVFHGVDGVGWEALPGSMLRDYFTYIKQKEKDVWVATFADASKYVHERMNAEIETKKEGDKITVELTHKLDSSMYNLPLTLRTNVPDNWKTVQVKQGDNQQTVESVTEGDSTYVMYKLVPNAGKAELVMGM